ncbi:ABC transporter permease [Streptomyces camponoticapitis]|uniref:ABC transporter permease n=1 Tax=Streptomyces camponoticapitis TaxID=1616125 RepID=A0ABQ2DZG8_9ACTN|nr:ABC transporter permease [Streptomyces camponoticapitis]GGJ76336.1 ABC transporter permease [Streptomyces camponoticapitis]
MTIAAATEPAARFRDLLASEWLKLWSLRSTLWAYAIGTLVVVGFTVGATYDRHRYWNENGPVDRTDFVADGIALMYAYTTNAGLIMMLAAGAIGAVAITGEYSTGLIRTTFAAVPARRSLMAAKVCVLTAVMTMFGAVAAALSFWLSQAILARHDAGVSITDPGSLRVFAASTLLAPVCGLVGMAIGTVLRHGGATVVTVVVVLLVAPLVLSEDRHWPAVVNHALPSSAWLRLVDMRYDPGSGIPFPWTVGGAWTVFALWALAASAATMLAPHRRDQ